MTSNRSDPDITIRISRREDVPALVSLRIEWTQERRATLAVDAAEFEREFTAWFEREADKRTFWLATRRSAGGADHPIGMVNLLRFERMPWPGNPAPPPPVDGQSNNGSGGGWGYLGNMFVVASERNSGVGERMLRALLEHADDAGLERIVLNPSELSVPFYRRHGFMVADQLMLRPLPSKPM